MSAGAEENSVLMLCDVEHVAVRCPDEEPAHTPGLGSQRVHDLVPALLGLVELLDRV